MRVFEDMSTWLNARNELTHLGSTIGFVPTMGALHAGHLSLVERSKRENDCTAVSIFVNPTQFNNQEDLAKYPRQISQDLELLAGYGVDVVLLPQEKEIYADGYRFKVTESDTSRILCGAHRPGHFEGVLTIVMKLLGLAQAQNCYMGEKDYQQFKLIQEMTSCFFINTQIVPCPIVREESGLAMSSRNQRLTPAGQKQASLLFEFLNKFSTNNEVKAALQENGFEVEYVEEAWGRRFVAAWIEGVRLIDNVKI